MSGPVDVEVELFLPTDWYDVLADDLPGPEGDAAARARFLELLTSALPEADAVLIRDGAEALMGWRAAMWEQGVISHGIVNCPFDPDAAADPLPTSDGTGWVSWHILTAVVEFPPVSPDLNLGELLARMVGQKFSASSYVESFETDLGHGTGVLMRPELVPAEGANPGGPGVRRCYGLAVAAASPSGGGTGLLVSGVCLDPEHLLEVAGLVAVIAGKSRVHRTAAEVT